MVQMHLIRFNDQPIGWWKLFNQVIPIYLWLSANCKRTLFEFVNDNEDVLLLSIWTSFYYIRLQLFELLVIWIHSSFFYCYIALKIVNSISSVHVLRCNNWDDIYHKSLKMPFVTSHWNWDYICLCWLNMN